MWVDACLVWIRRSWHWRSSLIRTEFLSSAFLANTVDYRVCSLYLICLNLRAYVWMFGWLFHVRGKVRWGLQEFVLLDVLVDVCVTLCMFVSVSKSS